jgi:hypothetical protein
MIDTATNKSIRARDSKVGPYIVVSVPSLDAVQKLLTQNGISFWTDHFRISVNGRPMETMVYVDEKFKAEEVQKILDQDT